MLSKRLELRLDQQRLQILEAESQRKQKSIAQLIRDAIDACYPPHQGRAQDKLDALTKLGEISAPISDWEQMEREIRNGMLK